LLRRFFEINLKGKIKFLVQGGWFAELKGPETCTPFSQALSLRIVIKIVFLEMLGETELPPNIKPVNGVLM